MGIVQAEDENIRSLRSLITYGIKGIGAYSKHANALLKDNPEIDAFIQKALAATMNDDMSVDSLVSLALEVGKTVWRLCSFWIRQTRLHMETLRLQE